MTTLIKIIVTTLLSMFLLSCNFDVTFNNGIKGTGPVSSVNRTLDSDFSSVKISDGLDLYLTQGDTESLTVEANENLHDLIQTKVENGVLRIYSDKNIGHAEAKKINLTFKYLTSIKSTSGSDVFSTKIIRANQLELISTSGSDMDLEVETETLKCKATSGSDLKLKGQTNTFNAQATSGSDIDAEDLIANSSRVKATSGAGITVNSKKELYAKATSGGDVTYYGNPEKVEKSDGVSGSISKR
ncbi:head GIN domain-containing protein [Lacinutrix iliipiscaria]|uniref:Head GIN domain-containing protein n=1 Tax=Lacinutrix iliipiscaria TaxID=1230532 RepID=A0ABW5WQT7_9FLAO